jgi:hypothetical protein
MAEILKLDGPNELALKNIRGPVTITYDHLTLQIERDIYGHVNILVNNLSESPLMISKKSSEPLVAQEVSAVEFDQ